MNVCVGTVLRSWCDAIRYSTCAAMADAYYWCVVEEEDEKLAASVLIVFRTAATTGTVGAEW